MTTLLEVLGSVSAWLSDQRQFVNYLGIQLATQFGHLSVGWYIEYQ